MLKMTSTKQPRCPAFIDEKKNTKESAEYINIQKNFLDSLDKLCFELDDLLKEKSIKNDNLMEIYQETAVAFEKLVEFYERLSIKVAAIKIEENK